MAEKVSYRAVPIEKLTGALVAGMLAGAAKLVVAHRRRRQSRSGPLARRRPSGTPHIAYYDMSNGALRYAHYDGAAGWSAQTVDSTRDAGRFPSLALDGTAMAHISYGVDLNDHDRQATGRLRYVRGRMCPRAPSAR